MLERIESIEEFKRELVSIFKHAGIGSIEQLMEMTNKPGGLYEVSHLSGVSEVKLKKWLCMVDLFRVKGVGTKYAEIFNLSGVHSVEVLANSHSESLFKKVYEINSEKNICLSPPTMPSIKRYIHQAKLLVEPGYHQ